MKPPEPYGAGLRLFIAAIVVLGLVGGSLIVAHSGFETSPRRGGRSVFVPAPQAYLLAATMYGMSVVAWVALLRERTRSTGVLALSLAIYAVVAAGLCIA